LKIGKKAHLITGEEKHQTSSYCEEILEKRKEGKGSNTKHTIINLSLKRKQVQLKTRQGLTTPLLKAS